MQLQLVDQASVQGPLHRSRPPATHTSLPPAAARACSTALAMPCGADQSQTERQVTNLGVVGRLVSVPVSVHQPALDRTVAVWLDSAPDLSCTDSTQAYCVDVEHQPTDLVPMEFVEPASRGWGLQVVAFSELAGVAQLHVGLLVGRVAGSDRSAAFQLGIQLRAEQDGGIGQPQPHKKNDDAGQAAVGLVVGTEVGHI